MTLEEVLVGEEDSLEPVDGEEWTSEIDVREGSSCIMDLRICASGIF